MSVTPSDANAAAESSAVRTKLNQVAYNYFTKTAQVIALARSDRNPSGIVTNLQPKVNKWFNLDLPEVQEIRDSLRQWKSIDISNTNSADQPPPLVVEVFLDLRNLKDRQSVLFIDSFGKYHPVPGGSLKSEIVLERWVIEFQPHANRSVSDMREDDLPVVYKKAIVLMRSLYTYLRLLPTWDLASSLSSRAKLDSEPLHIGCRVVNGSRPITSKGRVGLSKHLAKPASPSSISSTTSTNTDHLNTVYLSGLNVHVGELQISVSYRKHVDFRVGDSEAILSNHFRTMDGNMIGASRDSTSLERNSHGSLKKDFVGPLIRDHYRELGSSREGGSGAGPSVSFIKPFKSPSISNASPDMTGTSPITGTVNPNTTTATGTSSSPRRSSFTRIPSNSSLAALRIPRRTMSVTSTSSTVSTSSTSAPKYSSSFGTRNIGSLPKHVSHQPQHQHSWSNHSIRNVSPGSTASSLDQPGSGLYIPSVDLGDFVKMIDSASFGESSFSVSTGASASGGGGGHQHSTSDANVQANMSALTSLGSSNNPEAISPSDQLARFKNLKASHASLTESMSSSFHQIATTAKPPSDSFASHTPAVPSRLSEEFVVDEEGHRVMYSRRASRSRNTPDSGPNSAGLGLSGGTGGSGRHASLSSVTSQPNANAGTTHQQRTSTSPSSSDPSSSLSDMNLNHLLMLQSRRSYCPRYSPSAEPTRSNLGSSPRDRSSSPRLRSPSVPTSAPLDIPGPYITAISRNRPESTSMSNQRTMGYSDLHPSYDLGAHHHSLGPSPATTTDQVGSESYSPANRSSLSTSTPRDPLSHTNAYQSHHRLSQEYSPRLIPNSSSRRYSEGRSSALQVTQNSYEDDDLLFAMSDMHVTGKADGNHPPY